IEATRRVPIQRTPDKVAYRQPYRATEHQGPRIAVQADPGVNDNTIAIVLDATGSMGVAEGVEYTPSVECKYHRATTQLRAILRQLPPGTRVSIWLFGHANPKNATGVDRFPEDSEKFLDPTQKLLV